MKENEEISVKEGNFGQTTSFWRDQDKVRKNDEISKKKGEFQ